MSDYPNLVTLQKAQDVSHQPANIYVDSVKQITVDNHPALFISGSFPDACTHLSNVSHQINNETLTLNFSAWRNTDKMCAQVLTPFSFIYEQLEDQEITSRSEVFINDTAYSY
ncbi:hypothetical protein LX73_1849 [Fodinibius salinus]|uniref:Uncharacterized protein n=1 Tax=Fodinibius salinus TaxID=860790 RepID=A0A5D3YJV0_9BACT|nr:hypothetical protein [Fodinibius salinus]TYP94124.1 hypothetical protein LX73_1849 [Fodinibius salinus]